MISWISYPYQDGAEKYSLSQRNWDGYDKPEYYEMIEITNEERDLCSGRLSNFCSYYTTATFRDIKIPRKDRIKFVNWLIENSIGKWGFEMTRFYGIDYIFDVYFKEDADALAFKIEWVNYFS